MMAGVDFICLVATSLTFETSGFSILSVVRVPALLLLIPALDLCISGALIAGRFTAGPAVLVPADFTAGLFTDAVLTATRAGFLTAPLKIPFFPIAGLAGAFIASFVPLLEAGLTPIFTTVFMGLTAGFSALVVFFANLAATLFRVDAPVFPVLFVLAILVGLADVLPGFRAATVFLADFVTVAFMSSILNELSNALTSSGAARDLAVLAADKAPAPLLETTVVYTKHCSSPRIKVSLGRFLPMKTILLPRTSESPHFPPTSVPII